VTRVAVVLAPRGRPHDPRLTRSTRADRVTNGLPIAELEKLYAKGTSGLLHAAGIPGGR
jgi:hypothetical protein